LLLVLLLLLEQGKLAFGPHGAGADNHGWLGRGAPGIPVRGVAANCGSWQALRQVVRRRCAVIPLILALDALAVVAALDTTLKTQTTTRSNNNQTQVKHRRRRCHSLSKGV
jgi:hypothetical protein